MYKYIIIISFVFLIVSCTTTAPRGKQAWSKKPYFASLMIDDVQYTLGSTNNKYSLNKPVDFKLTLKNSSNSKKEFKTTDNKFLICTIKAEHPKKSKKIIIKSTDVIKKNNFSILPGEERVFDFSIKLDDEIVQNNEYLYSKINLYFLKRQLRRNSLTIYLERE
ncbi:MAG: hypothetical protein GQ534_08065 [Candidatus Delongbacteria bacterium]|nr:hypothetical protein [Candidatus Delongbacteria bacterium]